MKFGLMFANTGPFAKPQHAAKLAKAAETSGFESIWTVEHVIWPEAYNSQYPYSANGKMPGDSTAPIPDPLIWLTYIAANTSTIRLATGILILPQRNPLVLAKSVATLDVLCGGRLDLGIGVGWLEEEFDAIGVSFAERGKITDDYIAAMRSLWAGDGASYDGTHATFHNVSSNPKPVRGDVPIVVGGHSNAAARRAGRVGSGFFPGKGSIEDLRKLIDIVRQTASDHGRDPESIEITAGHEGIFGDDPVGAAEELASIGVTRTTLPAFLLFKGDVESNAQSLAERFIKPCAAVGR